MIFKGLYRTGKSFLLNRVILNNINKGFPVSSTIISCTRGIYVWPELIENDTIVFDVEGFGGMSENAINDTKLLFFSLLLSSLIIYNQ